MKVYSLKNIFDSKIVIENFFKLINFSFIMKYLLFTDIHSNLAALEKFVKLSKDLDYDKSIFLGDAVGYFTQADETLDLLMSHAEIIIPGNHDNDIHTITSYPDPDYLKEEFGDSLCLNMQIWTAKNLSVNALKSLEKINSLPKFIELDKLIFSHADPSFPGKSHHINNLNDAKPYFKQKKFSKKLAFIGHAHIPQVYSKEKKFYFLEKIVNYNSSLNNIDSELTIDLSKSISSLVVVPSLGQPRDHDPRGGFAIYDSETKKITIKRFEYDIQKTILAVNNSNLESCLKAKLVTRLEEGV